MTLIHGIWPPHFRKKVTMSENLSRMCHEETEQSVFSGRQLHFLTAFADDSCCQIDFKIARLKYGISALTLIVSKRRANAREQFARTKRLGHVIIRSGIECADLVILAVAHAQNNNRHVGPF